MLIFDTELLLAVIIGTLPICELIYPYKRMLFYSITAASIAAFFAYEFTQNAFLTSIVLLSCLFSIYLIFFFARMLALVKLSKKKRARKRSENEEHPRQSEACENIEMLLLTDSPPHSVATAYCLGEVICFQNMSEATLCEGETATVTCFKEKGVLYHA